MSNKEMNIQQNSETEYTLIKADEEKFVGVSYSLPLTLSYLGVFSSLVCEFMVIMSALSKPDHAVNYVTLAGGALVFALCVVGAVIFNILQKKSLAKAEIKRNKLLETITPINGKITGVNKYVTHIHHGENLYEQALWTFTVEYADSKSGESKTLESEQYLNDVTEVLKDNDVKIYFTDDDSFELAGFSFRTNENDEKYDFIINEKVVGEETVYTFDTVGFGKKKSAEKGKKK